MPFALRPVAVPASSPEPGDGAAPPERHPDPCAREDVEAALRAIPELTSIAREGGGFKLLCAGDEGAFTVFFGPSDPLPLAEVRLAGTNGHTAIRIACALVPLYGPMDLQMLLGPDQRIDGREPSA